jgi:predicted PurR-regulated permease PerM
MIGLLVGNFGSIISKFSNIAMMVFLSLIAFYFLLKDSIKLKNAVIKISPLSEKNTNKIIITLGDTTKTVIRGSLIITMVQGILVGIGFWIFGLDNPVLWGSVSIVTSLIPVVGAALVIIPGIISLVISGNIFAAIGLATWSILLVGTSDNFLRPYLIGNNSYVHPLLVLFSVLGGLAIFGATGFLLGPLALSFFLTLIEIYPEIISKEK